MPLWSEAILIVILAILIDRFIGEFPNRYHPLRWMGNILGGIDKRLKKRDGNYATVLGFLSYLFILILFGGIAIAMTAVLRTYVPDPYGKILWIISSAFILKLTFAIFSFNKHCEPVCSDLENGNTVDAADKVRMIVSRNTEGMDEAHIASSCCETISENYADSVCTPTFFMGLLGIPGAFIYRCANLMDAMWGYRNEKYEKLGKFPAILDDILGFLTSRISALFLVLGSAILGMDWRNSWKITKEDNKVTASPNSGYPMAAAAGALGIKMDKENSYTINKEARFPGCGDIRRCLRLVEFSSVLFMILVTVPLFVFLGVHVQIYFEDLFVKGIEWIAEVLK